MRRVFSSLPVAILLTAALAVLGSFPFVLHLPHAVPGPSLSPAAQILLWFPWQIADNLEAGRALLDTSVFVPAPEGDLLDIVGNPGFGLLLSALQPVGDPLFAFNISILLVAWTNILAAWRLGRALRPDDALLPWALATMAAGAGWMWSQLGAGAFGSAWLAPAIFATILVQTGRRAVWRVLAAAVWLGLGGLAAPVVTGATMLVLVAVSGLELPKRLWVILAFVVVVVGLLVPPVGANLPLDGFPMGALMWPAAGAAVGLPLVVGVGLWEAAQRRRFIPLGAAAALLLAGMGPVLRLADGSPQEIAGFHLVVFPVVGALDQHARTLLTVGALLAGLGAISFWDRLSGRLRLLILVLGFFEARGQEALGQPVRLWTEHVLRVPDLFVKLGETPRTTPILQIPPFTLNQGAVIWVPWHRQAIVGGPGINQDTPMRAAVAALLRDPVFGTLVNSPDLNGAGSMPAGWRVRAAGYRYLAYYGVEANARVVLTQAYGTAILDDGALAVYDMGDRELPPIEHQGLGAEVSVAPVSGEDRAVTDDVPPPSADAGPLPGTERLPRGTPPPGVIPRRDPSPSERPMGPPGGAAGGAPGGSVPPGSPGAPQPGNPAANPGGLPQPAPGALPPR